MRMRPEEVLVRGLLGLMLFFAIFAIASTLYDAGLAWYVIILWCICTLFIGLLFGTFFHFFPKSWSGYFIAFIVGAAALALILQFRIIPICGDNVCSVGECKSCSKDCQASQCLNGICEKTERCDTSSDCACTSGTTCAPARNGSSPRGCIEITCGDKFCDATESAACCKDCGCKPGFECANNVCFFEVPKLSFSPYVAAPALSATTLAGNPFLTNESGAPRPLAAMTIESTKNIQNVKINFSLKGVSSQVQLGNMAAKQNKTAFFYLHHDPRFLNVLNDEHTNITATITYYDVQNDYHTLTKQIPFTILGRGASDKYGHVLLFTTRSITPESRTPAGIWDELRRNMTARAHTGTQFPLETVITRTASQRDMAVLLYSAYLNAGLKPSIMENEQGVFIRVRYIDGNVIIDPGRINATFDGAITTGPGFTLSDEQTRITRNFTTLALNRSQILGANIRIETKLDSTCAGEFRVVALHILHNDGEVTENICATSRILGPGVSDEKKSCYTIQAHGNQTLRHGYAHSTCFPVQASVSIESIMTT
jgi:hypothetical protein